MYIYKTRDTGVNISYKGEIKLGVKEGGENIRGEYRIRKQKFEI